MAWGPAADPDGDHDAFMIRSVKVALEVAYALWWGDDPALPERAFGR